MRYKNPHNILLVLLLFVFGSTAAYAKWNFTGNLKIKIHKGLSVIEDVNMDFAYISPDPAGDTITLSANDTISAAGTSSLSGTPVSGEFTATGTENAAIDISFSPNNSRKLSGPGSEIPLNNYTHNAGVTPALDALGSLTFKVGVDLSVGASQAVGTYTGTYKVIVNYN